MPALENLRVSNSVVNTELELSVVLVDWAERIPDDQVENRIAKHLEEKKGAVGVVCMRWYRYE